MSLFVNQESNRSELQNRIAVDLSEKAKKKSTDLEIDRPDGVDNSAYMEGKKLTTSLAWVWILIVVALIIVTILLFVVRASA